jgi:hypothetical protein
MQSVVLNDIRAVVLPSISGQGIRCGVSTLESLKKQESVLTRSCAALGGLKSALFCF